ncbi:RNA polymerase sigma factor [Agromyces badenianii]|uniref:RNA polymerase sigma factor n=1 Tax=Agromyces badenianii TaxID=2080742 RepID=UPI001059CFED|nr:sigma-70 family RNA polymerase sigma factor [Agromyces badenianii]
METGTDDAEMVLANERAFETTFRAHYRTIFNAAYHRLNNLRDAEDAAAEVFSVAWRHRAESPVTYTLPWLYGVLRNVVGSEYRRRERASLHDDDHEEAGVVVDPGSADAAAADDARQVRQAVATLELADRELIWMAYWEDLTREEMSVILGCSPAAVRVRLLRARHRLKVALDAQNADPGPRQKKP